MVHLLRFLLLPVFCLFAAANTWAESSPAPLAADTVHRALISEVAVLVDKKGEETIDSVVAADESRFRPLARVFSAGYTRDVHWLRVTLRRESAAPLRWLLEVGHGYLDDVRLYTPAAEPGGGYIERRSGDRLPFAAREQAHRNFVFNLVLPDNTATYTAYLRVQTTSTTVVQLSLWTPEKFGKATMGEYLILGMLLGVLCLMLVYAIPYWFLLRERIYLLFIGQVVSMLIAFLGTSGVAAQFVFPMLPRLTDLFAPIGTCLLNLFGFWFFLDFLDIRQRHPWLFRLFILLMSLAVLALPGPFLGYYTEIAPVMMAVSLLCLPFCVVAAWQSMGKGVLGSRWIFAAYAWYCIIISLNLMSVLGLADGRDLYLLGWQYGAPLFVVFLQQAVLTRVRTIEHERKEALIQVDQANVRVVAEQEQRAAQDQFLSLMAHELKTPLATIDAAVQALNYMSSNDPAVNSRHDRIRHSVAQLNALLEQSLNALRGESNDVRLMTPRRELVMIEEVFAALSVECEEMAIQVRPTGVVSCYADRHMLHTVLANLLDNARKYGRAGEAISLDVTRLSRDGRTGVAFQVTSAYTGDLHEDCEAWFGKFWRARSSNRQEGVGLGLYLVRVIAEAHRGAAYCTLTDQGRGPRLVVSLWVPERAERAGKESA